MDVVLDILLDALKDTLVLVPFLFVTYIAVSLIELFAGERANAAIQKAGFAGPAIGAVLGLIPQCGFSAMGSMLFADRIVTLGTLAAVILSTSDEMLPLLVAEHVPAAELFKVLATKALIGLVAGFAIDAFVHMAAKKSKRMAALLPGAELPSEEEGLDPAEASLREMEDAAQASGPEAVDAADGAAGEPAEREYDPSQYSCDCGCGEPLSKGQVVQWVLINSAYRTAQVTVFIFVITLALTALIQLIGEAALAAFLSQNAVLATFASGLVGMVPNCAASVVITQLYLDGALGFGPMMAGTLVAAGAGYLVLFSTNANPRENAGIALLMYAIGVASGLVLLALGL